jgi:biotin carboxylase
MTWKGFMIMEHKKPIAIVLGGSAAHSALIEILKNRGFRTVLIDYYENPVARKAADVHIRESTLDQETVLEIARKLNADLVISACVDQANISACYALEKLGKNVPYSYQTALEITNKGKMKDMMVRVGIPTSKHIRVKNLNNIRDIDLRFPVMVKPADCCSSTGVKKAESLETLVKYLPYSLSCSRSNEAVVEEFVDGIEVSAYCFISDGHAKIISTAERLSVTEDSDKVIRCYGTISPSSISAIALAAIEETADKIAVAYELDNTPLFIQAIISQDKVNIIEFAPRVSGGLSYRTILENTGFDILSATVDSYLGIPVKTQFHKPDCLQTVNIMYANPGIFDKIVGYQAFVKNKTILDIFEYKTKGTEINATSSSGSRVGAFIIKGQNCFEIIAKTQRAISNIDVLDINGISIYRPDLNLCRDLPDYEFRANLEER